MTFSILVRIPETNTFGGAVCTGNIAVGSRVLHAKANTGLVASQGFSGSEVWSIQAMQALSRGEAPGAIVARLTREDAGGDHRQLTVMNQAGDCAGFTGNSNEDFKADYCFPNMVVAGNWLAGDAVLTSLHNTFASSSGPLPERLLASLKAAAMAGGDSRGLMSAAIKIVSTSAPSIDLRIDYSKKPIDDLSDLYQRTLSSDYLAFMNRLPTIDEPFRF